MSNIKLSEIVSKDAILVNLKAEDKEEVLEEMVTLLVESGALATRNKKDVLQQFVDREKAGSTGIGGGVALPHIRSELLKKFVGAIGISKNGVNYKAIDGEPVYVFFMFISPVAQSDEHKQVLRRLANFLSNDENIQFFKTARNTEDVAYLLKECDEGC